MNKILLVFLRQRFKRLDLQVFAVPSDSFSQIGTANLGGCAHAQVMLLCVIIKIRAAFGGGPFSYLKGQVLVGS